MGTEYTVSNGISMKGQRSDGSGESHISAVTPTYTKRLKIIKMQPPEKAILALYGWLQFYYFRLFWPFSVCRPMWMKSNTFWPILRLMKC